MDDLPITTNTVIIWSNLQPIAVFILAALLIVAVIGANIQNAYTAMAAVNVCVAAVK